MGDELTVRLTTHRSFDHSPFAPYGGAMNSCASWVYRVATSQTKKKATRNRQNKTIERDDAPRQTPWTTVEEIALAKGWLAVSGNSKLGTKSGAGDIDYVQRAMIHYEIETRLSFKLRHYWEILKDRSKWQEIAIPNFKIGSEGGIKRHKSSGSSSFNTESGEASINLNTNVGNNDEDEEKEERLTFLKIKRRDVECRERELEQQDMMFYLQLYDHLTGDQRKAMDEIRAKLKTKYNL
nr:hypothetical protein [Tanacetum cinerariifolium]